MNVFPNERAKLAADAFISRASKSPRNEGEVWQLTAAQIERQEQGTADDLSYAIRWMDKSYPACLNPDAPCKQGDRLCPTPDSCRLPERSSRLATEATKLILWFLGGLAVFAVFSFAAIKWG